MLYILVILVTLANGQVNTWVVDYGLTQSDCLTELTGATTKKAEKLINGEAACQVQPSNFAKTSPA